MMRTLKKARPLDAPPRSLKRFANRFKALTGRPPKRASFFLLVNALYGLVFSAHFAPFFRFSLEQENYPHFSLILLVSFYLIYIRRQQLSASAAFCARGGIPLVLVGVLGYVLGFVLRPHLGQNDFLSLTTLGIVTTWIGCFVTFFGSLATRMALFPLGFLVFIIPPPEALLYHIITALQYASVEVTYVLFKLIALPVFREGMDLALPGLTIEVARECSSIRSSMALLITSVLLNHLFLRRWWSKVVILLLVFPLAVFKNGVRIVTLSLLTIYVDKGFMQGGLHNRGGAVFFGLALVMLTPIFLGLRKLESRRAGSEQQAMQQARQS